MKCMKNLYELKKLLSVPLVKGKLAENIGLGIFVNSSYGLSDGSLEIFNIIDMVLSILLILVGIILQRSIKKC